MFDNPVGIRNILFGNHDDLVSDNAVFGAVELEDSLAVKDLPANLAKFYNELDFLPKPKKGNKPKCCTLC